MLRRQNAVKFYRTSAVEYLFGSKINIVVWPVASGESRMNMNSKFVILVGISLGLFALALLLLMSNSNSANLLNSLLCLGYAIAGGLGLIASAIAPDGGTVRSNDRTRRENESLHG